MKNNKEDDICYRTKMPKLNIRAKWQIELGIVANTNKEDFATEREYKDYIRTSVEYAMAEQNERLKQAWKELGKQKNA